jgi:hypothetical protein
MTSFKSISTTLTSPSTPTAPNFLQFFDVIGLLSRVFFFSSQILSLKMGSNCKGYNYMLTLFNNDSN